MSWVKNIEISGTKNKKIYMRDYNNLKTKIIYDMRRVLLSMLIVMVVSASINAQESSRYAVKSGYIKLELSGSTTGTREIWWDDYGDKTYELEESVTYVKMFGMENTEKTHKLTINIKDSFWTIDYLTNEAFKGELEYYDAAQEFADSMTDEEKEAFANKVLESFGGQKQGTEKLGGYECDVYNVMGAKSWIYKGIPIKSTANIMGIENNEMFVEFKPGCSVPSSKFNPPSEYDYQVTSYN